MSPILRRPLLLPAALILLALSSCTKRGNPDFTATYNRFSDLRKEFREPPARFGTIPFFVWNGIITPAEIDRYLQDFKNAGCGGVFIHARPGLVTSYLTPEWFDLFRYAVDRGKKYGLTVWIYDEYNFPSGFAGGHVPAEMPESWNQGQGLLLKPAEGKGKGPVYSKTYFNRGPADYYFHGEWYGGYTYVDVLVKGVTEKFVHLNLDGYAQKSGNEFGRAVPGIFTDEPHLNTPGGIRWTPDLYAEFQKRWGYSLEDSLPALFRETGDWRRVRHNYAQTMLDLFIDRWAKPYSGICREKGMLFTGHYWEHNWPYMELGPDNMAMYPWFSIPGIDMLFNQFNETATGAQFGNVRSVKELSSVANQTGMTRTLSETYGGGGWDLTLADMKRLGDWEYALGVNLMNIHMSPVTEEGYRKYDHPPHFTYHEPWWPDFGYLNRYFVRLSAALSSGKEINDLLILEPTTSAWMYDSYAGPDPHTRQIGDAFQALVTRLARSQAAFDLGSESIIRNHGRAENGRFIVGQRRYSRVVIPPQMENINRSTFNLLKDYVTGGGKLYACSIPSRIDGSADNSFSQLATEHPREIIRVDDSLQGYENAFTANPDPAFERVEGGDLYHNLRILDDGKILFLANADTSAECSGSVRLTGGMAVVMDPFTGDIREYPSENPGDGQIRVAFTLPPAGSLLLFISPDRIRVPQAIARAEGRTPVGAGSDLTVEPDRDNVIAIDFCDLLLDGDTTRGMHVLDASDKVYRRYGFERGNPWAWYVQFENRLVARDTFGAGTGFQAVYHFRVNGSFDVSSMKAVTERPGIFRVSVNGTEVAPEPGQWYLDRHFGVFAIGKGIRPGDNELVLEVAPMKLMAEIEPVYLTGRFSVVPADQGWILTAPPATCTTGSWKKQGMPFYPWGMTYSRTFTIDHPKGSYELEPGKWKGTTAEVSVNGRTAGIIAFPPYRLDVTKYIRPGENRIRLTIQGSLKNLLGPYHNDPPRGLAISPFWRNVREQPPGRKYQLGDYGLEGGLELLNRN